MVASDLSRSGAADGETTVWSPPPESSNAPQTAHRPEAELALWPHCVQVMPLV